MRDRKLRTVMTLVMAAAMILSSVCVSFGSSGTKKMTLYNTFKKGKYVYCCTQKGIYKVNVKTGKKTRIIKEKNPEITYPGPLYVYKGYIYYTDGGAITAPLYRATTNGKNKKHLANVFDFAIKKGVIYYTSMNYDTDKTIKRKMALNGKNKRKSSYNIRNTYKKTNKSGYYVKTKSKVIKRERDSDGTNITERTNFYLVTPGKTIWLCRYDYEDYELDNY